MQNNSSNESLNSSLEGNLNPSHPQPSRWSPRAFPSFPSPSSWIKEMSLECLMSGCVSRPAIKWADQEARGLWRPIWVQLSSSWKRLGSFMDIQGRGSLRVALLGQWNLSINGYWGWLPPRSTARGRGSQMAPLNMAAHQTGGRRTKLAFSQAEGDHYGRCTKYSW